MKKITWCFFFIIMFSLRVQGQSLPNFMKDLVLHIKMIKPTPNPNQIKVFASNYIYTTDTNYNVISNTRFTTPNNAGFWSDYAEDSNVFAAVLDYAYVTPWESIIGNILCLVNRNTGETKTIPQDGFRSYYMDFNKDTLLVFNKNISSDSTFLIKKISKTGEIYSNKTPPYKANSIGKFKLWRHRNSIYLYSLTQFNTTTTMIDIKRLDISGNLIQSNNFNVSFPKNNGSIEITSVITEGNTHIIQIRRNDFSVSAPYEYYLFASDTLGNKLWERSINGKYSLRSEVLVSKDSDSTFMSYGCSTKDSIWTYFIQKHNLITGLVIDSVEGKLVHKPKELTYICYLSSLIRKSNGFDLLISYQNRLEKYSQYPISLVTKFSFDDQLNEIGRHTIRLNGYYLDEMWNVKYDAQNRITFMGEHRPSIASSYKSYLAAYDFNTDYERTYYTVGIDKTYSNNTIVVYPNPAYREFSVQGIDGSQYNYKLINTNGFLAQAGELLESNSIENLPDGLYFLLVYKNDELIHSQKIIVIK